MDDLVTKQGSSGSALTEADAVSMTDIVRLFQEEIGAVSVVQALQQAAFMLACDVIAQDMAKAPLQLRTTLDNGSSRVLGAREHPIAAFLADEPNGRHTWYEFKEMMGLWHALTMNSYAVVFRLRNGDIDRIVPVMSSRVQERIAGTQVFYDVTPGTLQEQALLGSTTLRVPERDIIHVRGRMLNGMDGYSTLLAGQKVLQTGQAIEEYRDDLFREGAQIRGVFERDWVQGQTGILPEEAFARLRSQLKLMMSKFAQANEPIVVEGGLKFKEIASNPQEAELTKQLEAQIVATARLLRVPPHKIFHLVNVKYENLDTMEKAYVGDTMEPICLRHEQRYAKALLTSAERRSGLFFEHDRESLWLTDYKAETERVVRLAERGIILVNEARARMNLQPTPWGDSRMVPVNMMLVDGKDNVLVSAAQDSASASADTQDQPADQPADGTAKGPVLRLVEG